MQTKDRILKRKEAAAVAGISATTIWRLERAGCFPRRVILSPGRIGWRLSDVEAWMKNRPERG